MPQQNSPQLESTLLSVIAQAKANGASRDEVAEYVNKLTYPSSKPMVEALFDPSGHSSLQKLVNTVKTGI